MWSSILSGVRQFWKTLNGWLITFWRNLWYSLLLATVTDRNTHILEIARLNLHFCSFLCDGVSNLAKISFPKCSVQFQPSYHRKSIWFSSRLHLLLNTVCIAISYCDMRSRLFHPHIIEMHPMFSSISLVSCTVHSITNSLKYLRISSLCLFYPWTEVSLRFTLCSFALIAEVWWSLMEVDLEMTQKSSWSVNCSFTGWPWFFPLPPTFYLRISNSLSIWTSLSSILFHTCFSLL